MDLDPAVLRAGSLLAYLLVFLGGIVTSIGPCNVAMIPLVIGFVGGSSQPAPGVRPSLGRGRSFALSLTFAVGLSITFMLLGVVASLAGGLMGGSTRIWYYVVAAICVLVGLSMLGVFHLPEVPGAARLRERVQLRGIPGALALGLVSGLVASQCATPVLAAILTYVMSQDGALVYGAALLFVYALGRGVPIVLAGTFTGALKQLQSFGRWSPIVERVSGVIIIGVGLYFLWIAWQGRDRVVNRTWERRAELEPSYEVRRRPTMMEVYKLLPRSNCKECGEVSCFVFANKLVAGHVELQGCPVLDEPECAEQQAHLAALLAVDLPAIGRWELQTDARQALARLRE